MSYTLKSPFEFDFTGKQTEEENAYYQGYLNEKDAEYLAGYDYAVEDVLESFCYNLDIYADDLEECGFDDHRLAYFERHFNDFIQAESTENQLDLETINDTQIRLILTLFRAFRRYAEIQRDEVGTTMIEEMDEADYDDCRKKCKQGYKNVLLRIQESKEKGEL